MGRLEAVGAQSYWFEYCYEPNTTTDRVKSTTALFVKKTEFAFGRDTITSVTNNVGFNTDQLLSRYAYEYGPDGQRLKRTTTHGDQKFTDTFGYDPDTGGVTTSTRDDASANYAVVSGNSNRPFMLPPGSSNEAIRQAARDMPASLHLPELSDSRCNRIFGHYGVTIGDNKRGNTLEACQCLPMILEF